MLRSKLWIAAYYRNDLSKTLTELYNNYRVCKMHFTKDYFLLRANKITATCYPKFFFGKK